MKKERVSGLYDFTQIKFFGFYTYNLNKLGWQAEEFYYKILFRQSCG